MGGAEAGGPALLRIEVCYSPVAGAVDHVDLQLPSGATLADALQASGVLARHGLRLDETLSCGIWCRAARPETPLRDRDRVEIWRPLQVDPKEARRQRYRGQRSGRG